MDLVEKLIPEKLFGVEGLGLKYREYWKPFLFGREPFEVQTKHGVVMVRPRSAADMYQIQEVLENDQYSPGEEIGQVEDVVDLGASIGDSTLWLIDTYHPKKIVAVEMSEGNFEVMQETLRRNAYAGEVIAVNKAIYKEDGIVGVHIQKFHEGHHLIEEDNETKAEAVTLKTLLEEAGMKKIDYLKMDIEGAERWVFTVENEELFREKVRYVHMEVHGPEQGGEDMQKTVEYFEKLGYRVKTRPVPFPGAMMLEAFNPAILEKM